MVYEDSFPSLSSLANKAVPDMDTKMSERKRRCMTDVELKKKSKSLFASLESEKEMGGFEMSTIASDQEQQAEEQLTESSEVETRNCEELTLQRSSNEPDEELTKSYKCKVDIDFPETEREQQIILRNITAIIKNLTSSPLDLDFIREKVLDDYETEIAFMDFENLASMDLRTLPWSKIAFEAVKLTKGSAVLFFNLKFEKAPRNIEDVNVYRLMELFVKSTIENIPFVKSVDPKNEVNSEGSLTFRLQADRLTFDDRTLDIVLNHVRGTVKQVLGETSDLTGQNVDPCDLSDERVEIIFKDLLERTRDEEVTRSLESLTPRCLRELIKEISKMAKKEEAEVIFEFETTDKKNKATKENESPSSTFWLFPFNFRRIDDLSEDTKVKIITELIKYLPNDDDIWSELLTNLQPIFTIAEVESLMGELSQYPRPYLKIVKAFSDRGGTVGGLLQGLDKTMDHLKNISTGQKCKIQDINLLFNYRQAIKEIQTKCFDELLADLHCPCSIQHITSLQQFQEKIRRHELKLGSNDMKRFREIQNTLREGDQLWIYHKRPLMRSYAHVAIVVSENSYIHVNSPEAKLAMRSRALICKGSLTRLQEQDNLCFVVRPEVPEGAEASIFRERAELCEGLRMDYNAESSNCETFANAILGNWGSGVQASKKKKLIQIPYSLFLHLEENCPEKK